MPVSSSPATMLRATRRSLCTGGMGGRAILSRGRRPSSAQSRSSSATRSLFAMVQRQSSEAGRGGGIRCSTRRSSATASSVRDIGPPVSREVDDVVAALAVAQLIQLGAQLGELDIEVGRIFFLDRGLPRPRTATRTIEPRSDVSTDLRLSHSVLPFRFRWRGLWRLERRVPGIEPRVELPGSHLLGVLRPTSPQPASARRHQPDRAVALRDGADVRHHRPAATSRAPYG